MTRGLHIPTGPGMIADHERRLRELERALRPKQTDLAKRAPSAGGLQSLITVRNNATRNYTGGYTETGASFDTIDAESFGSGLSFDSTYDIVIIQANGWYQAVGNLSVVVNGSVAGQRGGIRLNLKLGLTTPRTIGMNNTYADNGDIGMGVASKPFYVSDGYEEVAMTVSHDVLDGGAAMDLGDAENSDTFLSVFRVA